MTQPLFDDMSRQALYQATKGILRKVNKLALTALRLAASRKESTVGESGLRGGAAVSDHGSKTVAVLSLAQLLEQQPATAPACLVEPGLLPPQGILFVGGEPKVGSHTDPGTEEESEGFVRRIYEQRHIDLSPDRDSKTGR